MLYSAEHKTIRYTEVETNFETGVGDIMDIICHDPRTLNSSKLRTGRVIGLFY